MNRTSFGNIADLQRAFFFTGKSKDIGFRFRQLTALKQAIEKYEAPILEALREDLGKHEAEAYTTEMAPVLHEIRDALIHMKSRTRPKRIHTPVLLFPGLSHVHAEPYGSVLIIGPWNYPFQLMISPLVGAMAAGNCAVVKPSEIAPRTSKAMAAMLGESFEPAYISVVEGGREETQALLSQRFDYIFFTGGTRIGKIVMRAAAEHLTPLTLELGGKNPCIVDADSNPEIAATRIAWGKYLNAGQTCVAPDYLLVHASIKYPLLERIRKSIEAFYGKDPSESPYYGKIVNSLHFSRLSALLNEGSVFVGGKTDPENRYIAPTVLDNISWDHAVMREEIFGPILPVLEYEDLDDVIARLQGMPKPLATYFFSNDCNLQNKILKQLSSGGMSINDTFAHLLNQRLPFGGVGDSGMGAYHGKSSFDTFSHYKSVVKRSVWADPKSKYPPYTTPFRFLKTALKLMY